MSRINPDIKSNPRHDPSRQFLSNKQPSAEDLSSLGLKLIVKLSNRWLRLFFLVTFLSVSGAGYIYSTYGKIVHQGHVSSVVSLVDYMAHFLLTLSNVATVFAISQYERYKALIFNILLYIAKKTVTKTVFGIVSNIFNIIALVAFLCNGFVYISYFGWDAYQFHCTKDLQFAFLNMVLATTSEFIYCLKSMFNDINKELLSVYRESFESSQIAANISTIDVLLVTSKGNLKPNEPKINSIYLYKTEKCIAALRDITKKHVHLCQYMDDFNTLDGFPAFTCVVSVVANIIWATTLLIEYSVHEAVIGKVNPSTAVLVCNLLSCLAWIFIMLGQIILLGFSGRGLIAEGHSTSAICYKMLAHQAIQEGEQEGAIIKHQLTVLAKQAETRCPEFSAGGFFSFNLSNLGLVASNVFAYCIVVLQFVLNEH